MTRPLTLNLVNNTSSYDPMSPSYDPSAASPCNPFPTSSPFVPVTFKTTVKRPLQQSNLAPSHASLIAAVQAIPLPSREHQAALLPHIPPAHSAPSLRRTKPCRFYLDIKGCKSGRWCNFKHPVNARPAPGSTEMPPAPEGGWESVQDVRDLDPNWGKDTDGEVHPKFRTQPCKNYFLGLCRFGDKCQFIHPPEVATPFSIYSASAPIDYFNAAALASIPNVVASAVSKERATKPLNHLSIPCSNFEMDGECSHGSACQFIHKPKTTARRVKVPVKNNNKTVSQDKKEPTTVAESKPQRSKPVKKKTGAIKEASGIHKPTWRVLGGGVPLAIEVPKRGANKQQLVITLSSSPESTAESGTVDSSPSPSTISLPSPEDYLCLDPSVADLSQYDFATPTHFVHEIDFLRPPSPDVPLDISMGSPELYDFPTHHGPRKRVPQTGDDLIRQMREGSPESFIGSPDSRREKYRPKPQLTIHVPSTLRKSRSSIDLVKGNPGTTPFPHTTRHSMGPDEMEPVVESSEHCSSDTAVDWPEDAAVEEEEPIQSDKSYTFCVVDEIQRPHSTPPTPWSGNSIEVPILPRLPAESP